MIKYRILFLFLLSFFFSSGVFAQENQSVPSVAIYYTAQYVDYLIPEDSKYLNFRGAPESPKYSYTVGFELALPIRRNLFVNSGFSFFKNSYFLDLTVDDYELKELNGTYEVKTIVDNYFLQMPISLQYYFGDKKNRFYLKSGILIDWHFNANYDTLILYENGRSRSDKGSRRQYIGRDVVVAGGLGCGGEFKLNRDFRIFLEQESRLGLFDKKVEEFSQNRFDLGARVGFRFIWKDWNKV